jgi:ParB/RepB/Spo0J family partition protein
MQIIARDAIRPNDWNVNAFDPEQYPKLVESIREKGFLEPLKVMRDPAAPGQYLLIDGYHRWKAAGELGLAELPCEIWEISPEEAKIRGLQLNYLRGQPVPDRLAHLVHDLHRELTLEDLSGMLPWSTAQLRDSLELLKLPADLREQVEQQATARAEHAPIPVTVVMLPGEHQLFEEALARARDEMGKGARRGQLWAHVCRHYLAASAPERDGHDWSSAPEGEPVRPLAVPHP